ncbi:MAG: AMP-binding protein [Sphingomonadales bacterium]|nr:AMP-binding protein [Sphingomonadales bacterium]
MMARIRGAVPSLKAILVTGKPMQDCPFDLFDDVLEKAKPLIQPVAVDPDAVKLLMYTSGTTGRPKGVLHSHNTLFADAFKMRDALGLNSDDRIFCPSPITHVTGFLWLAQMPWYGDMLASTLRTWDAEASIALIQKYACSVMLGATPFLQDLVTLAKQDGQQLQTLRHYVCGGAAVPPTLIYNAALQFPNCIPWRTFGATEVCTLTVGPSSRDDLRFGAETDGRLSRVSTKLVGIHDGLEVGAGEEGELLVKAASMSLGYANPADNQEAYDEDGYFRMGDLGRIVEGEYFVCTGRKKDLIIRGGENISAKEIEDVLVRSPKILEAAVVSMPSKRTGEAICAFIVPADLATIDMKEIAGLISAEGLARQKSRACRNRG